MCVLVIHHWHYKKRDLIRTKKRQIMVQVQVYTLYRVNCCLFLLEVLQNFRERERCIKTTVANSETIGLIFAKRPLHIFCQIKTQKKESKEERNKEIVRARMITET